MAAKGQQLADKLIAKYKKLPKAKRPQAWFTYHLYYKAVDWIGPRVAAALDIPYLVAEASHAPKRARGPSPFPMQRRKRRSSGGRGDLLPQPGG